MSEFSGELIFTDKLVRCEPVLRAQQSSRMMRSGQSAVNRYGPSWWALVAEYEFMTMAEAARAKAWIERRDLAAVTFTAFSLFQVKPRGVVTDPDAVLEISVDADTNTVVLAGVEAADNHKAGDMVSYRTDTGGYCLLRVIADTDPPEDVSGTWNLTCKVAPRPLPAAGTPAVRRVQALGEFELTTVPDPFDDYTSRRLAFEARSILR